MRRAGYKVLPYAAMLIQRVRLYLGHCCAYHDGHLEDTKRTFCSLYHTYFVPSAQGPKP